MTNTVTLQSSPNFGSNPLFTLVGDTSGGPPTGVQWRRNGRLFSTGTMSRITTVVNPNNDQEGRENCRYRSMATINAVWPGRYEYTASNRATPGGVSDSFTIEGKV